MPSLKTWDGTQWVDIQSVADLTVAEADARYATIDFQNRIDARVFDARKHGADYNAADNITAINAAITEAHNAYLASGAIGRVVVGASARTYTVRPDQAASHWIKLKSGVILDLSDVTLKIPNDCPPYNQLITGATMATLLENVAVVGGAIDQNPTGHTLADIGSTYHAFAIGSYSFKNFTVDGVKFIASGTNTVTLNAANGENAVVRDCDFRFIQGASATPNYDNSSIYITARGIRVANNRFYSTINQGARGCCEIHGPLATFVGNIGENFETLLNATPPSNIDVPTVRNNVVAVGNSLVGGNYGIMLWPIAAKMFSNILIADNTIQLSQIDHNHVSTSGIIVNRSIGMDGEIENLTIADNIITFQPNDTRTVDKNGTALGYASTNGITVNARGHSRNAIVKGNMIVNAPAYGIHIGDAAYSTAEVRGAVVRDNVIVDAGANPNLASGARCAIALHGTLYDVDVRDNIVRDTGATALVGNYVHVVAPVAGARNTLTRTRTTTASGVAMLNSNNDTYVSYDFKRITVDLPNIVAGGNATFTVTVRGAALGDIVVVQPLQGIEVGLTYHAYVSAADTVVVRVINTTAADIDPANRIWRVRLLKEDVDVT